jgi:hypothetical protein
MLKKLLPLLLFGAVAGSTASGCYVDGPPGVYVAGPRVWVPAHYQWNAYGYGRVWVPGHWRRG